MKKGLILEGGAMRGMFSAGATDVLMENGVEFDGLIGVSAGACFGCNYKSRQPGRAIRYNLQYCADSRYCSLRSLLKTGDLFGADFCYYYLPEKLDLFDEAAYNANPMAFYVVGTDVESGEAVYHACNQASDDYMEWIRASASMPLVSRMVELEGKKLLDGGIADSIPLRYFQSIGYDRNLVVLTQPLTYQKGPNKMLPLIKMKYRRYPKLVEAIAKRHEIYNETTAYVRAQESAGEILVIRPSEPLPVGRVEHDPAKLRLAYELGRTAAENKIRAIKEFLQC